MLFHPDRIERTGPLSSAKSSVLTATKLALARLLIGSLSSTVCTVSNLAS